MPAHGFRDRTAIVGLGSTEYSKSSGVSTLTLAVRAIHAALADSGLDTSDLDGVACHRIGDSADPALVAQVLGLRQIRLVRDIFGGGSSCIVPLDAAAHAVASGQASCVVVWRALNSRSGVRLAGAANNPALSGDGQYWLPYLHVTAPQQFAMFARSYMSRFGVTAEDLGAVAVAQREYAISNPKAMMRQPLTIEQYMDSRWIAEPLRLYDCCLETDAAVALVVTSTARARDLRHPPVTISATVTGGGNQLTSNHHADLTDTSVAAMAKDLYESAQITPADVDVAELYDAFSPLVLLQLEQYGFCQSGEAAAFVRDGQTRRGGSTPTNTHGGHLSEGYVHGLNHVVEAVEQLRHSAGARQVPGAEVAISTAQPGINSGLTGAVALRRLT